MENNAIANQQATEEEIKAAKMAGTFVQFGRIMTEAGFYSMLRQGIDDPIYRQALLDFHQNYVPSELNYQVLLQWFQENNLKIGGSLEKEIKAWEIFYQKFYGEKFCLNRKKIIVDARRLPAIKSGLEIGAVNSVLIEVTPVRMKEEEQNWTEAQYFFRRILEPTGINIWAQNVCDRWTEKTLDEILAGYIPVLPEDFDLTALKENWIKECNKVAQRKGPPPKIVPGMIRISFVDNRQDIPAGQKYVSQAGEIVDTQDCSFVSAIENNIRLVTPAQEILLAAKIFFDSGEYLAKNTWEYNSALLKHKEKDPGVSVAAADSFGVEFKLGSSLAGYSDSYSCFRLSL